MREDYKNLSLNPEMSELIEWARQVTRERGIDLNDYEEQKTNNPFIYEVPSSSSDIIGTEKVGDIAADASYFYIVVDNSGTLEWRRVGISSF